MGKLVFRYPGLVGSAFHGSDLLRSAFHGVGVWIRVRLMDDAKGISSGEITNIEEK